MQKGLAIKDSILWGNTASQGSEMWVTGAVATVTNSYTDITVTSAPHVVSLDGAAVTWGSGILVTNPLFASDYTDLHLKSFAGRWDPASENWTNDPGELSPCIDAGDPDSDWEREPQPNAKRVNLGAYGNTPYASRSPTVGTLFLLR